MLVLLESSFSPFPIRETISSMSVALENKPEDGLCLSIVKRKENLMMIILTISYQEPCLIKELFILAIRELVLSHIWDYELSPSMMRKSSCSLFLQKTFKFHVQSLKFNHKRTKMKLLVIILGLRKSAWHCLRGQLAVMRMSCTPSVQFTFLCRHVLNRSTHKPGPQVYTSYTWPSCSHKKLSTCKW